MRLEFFYWIFFQGLMENLETNRLVAVDRWILHIGIGQDKKITYAIPVCQDRKIQTRPSGGFYFSVRSSPFEGDANSSVSLNKKALRRAP